MELNEAKKILNQNGFILEGSMSLQAKINNAKAFNAEQEDESDIIETLKEQIAKLNYLDWEWKLVSTKPYKVIGKNPYNSRSSDTDLPTRAEYIWYKNTEEVQQNYYRGKRLVDEDSHTNVKTVWDFIDCISADTDEF